MPLIEVRFGVFTNFASNEIPIHPLSIRGKGAAGQSSKGIADSLALILANRSLLKELTAADQDGNLFRVFYDFATPLRSKVG